MFIPVECYQHFIHQDFALVIEGLLQIVDAQGVFYFVVAANAVNFHGGPPENCGARVTRRLTTNQCMQSS